MVVKDYNQARALIKRVMEGMGGSADAYEEPLSESKEVAPLLGGDPTWTQSGRPQGTPPAEEILTLPQGQEGEIDCIDGIVDWDKVGDRIWTSPPPITEHYQSKGVVEDSQELLAIHKGFEKARSTGQPQVVQLETGMYQIEKTMPTSGWILKDPVKSRNYVQETNYLGLDRAVSEQDLFIWVIFPSNNHDVDLGYIHMGYVFLRKQEG